MAAAGCRVSMALLAMALLAATASTAQPGANLAREIVYAPTNAGLKPQRLQTFDRTHYYQLASNPRGTLVRGTVPWASGSAGTAYPHPASTADHHATRNTPFLVPPVASAAAAWSWPATY